MVIHHLFPECVKEFLFQLEVWVIGLWTLRGLRSSDSAVQVSNLKRQYCPIDTD